jgi:hypothetical protein
MEANWGGGEIQRIKYLIHSVVWKVVVERHFPAKAEY